MAMWLSLDRSLCRVWNLEDRKEQWDVDRGVLNCVTLNYHSPERRRSSSPSIAGKPMKARSYRPQNV
jgi:hypothetical protein